MAVVATAGLLFDPRELVGAPLWAKALKFGISIAVYAVTWSWIIGQLRRFRRTAWWAGTVMTVTLFIELAIITLQVARGHQSHYNNTNPFDENLWSIMGTAIAILWLATLVGAFVLWFTPSPDAARTLAIRTGTVISTVGLALGFLMTLPTPTQLDAGSDILGAHTVGAVDGGPGLPILGWSTEHGDLRIPHFVGMHALQLIPLALILLELAARRITALQNVRTRTGLVWTASFAYAAVVSLVTWQALRGQSIVAPDAVTLLAAGAIAVGVAAGVVASLRAGAGQTALHGTREDTLQG